MSLKTSLLLSIGALALSFPTFSSAEPGATPSVPEARQAGESDGRADGGREGLERGFKEGLEVGTQVGHRQGFEKCAEEERRVQYDRGYREGITRGRIQGENEGQNRGSAEGEIQGQHDGLADGIRRADTDSLRDSTPPGTQKGIDEADHSDAADRGYRDGIAAGDREARERALSYDYPRGRQDYRNEKFNEPIENHDEFSQTNHNLIDQLLSGARTGLTALGLTTPDVPDDRYYKPRRTYPTAPENDAYKSSYRSGYTTGFHGHYDGTKAQGYRQGFDQSYPVGCREGRNQNFKPAYEEGFANGLREGYRQIFQSSYDRAYRYTYDVKFRAFSERAYNDNYSSFYNRHFEEARTRAYANRVKQLYDAAFSKAESQKYNEVYPGYAAEQYNRGRVDETADFASRPVRLLSAEVTETIPNGVFEPGEALHLRVNLRNFDANTMTGKDIRVQIQALDPSSAVITQAEAVLSRDLRSKSQTFVNGILEFRFNESAVGHMSRFRVTTFYQGKNVGEESLDLVSKYMVDIRYQSEPEVHEGLPAELLFKIKNQANIPTDASLALKLATGSSEIEIVEGSANVGILNPGEGRVIKFIVIARGAGSSMKFPIGIEATATSRRVGLFTSNEEVPIINDYKITLKTSLDPLRTPGTIRAEYSIQDVSQRIVLKGLQLKIKITGDGAQSVQVIGPNPQYLNPLIPGESTRFIIPFVVTAANGGGTVELEVEEDGRAVVIHRVQF